MSYTSNIGGKLIVKAKGDIKSYAKENIEINTNQKITITGHDKGVTLNKNKKYKSKIDLKITKIEGPYDDKGNLASMISLGKSYTYKATPNRKPTISEVVMLRWATKEDDKKVEEIRGTSIANQLKDDKIIIGITINRDCEKVKIYAYFKKASDKTSVEIKTTGIFRPYIIAKSRHRKGMNEEGTAIHHDMMSRDMTDQQIIALNPDTKKWIDIVNKEGYIGVQKLAVQMEDLLTDFSQGELEEVNLKLYRKFIGNKEGDFSDEVLTRA